MLYSVVFYDHIWWCVSCTDIRGGFKIMKMLMLNVVNKDVKMVEANGLDDYYKFIGSNYVDIIHR